MRERASEKAQEAPRVARSTWLVATNRRGTKNASLIVGGNKTHKVADTLFLGLTNAGLETFPFPAPRRFCRSRFLSPWALSSCCTGRVLGNTLKESTILVFSTYSSSWGMASTKTRIKPCRARSTVRRCLRFPSTPCSTDTNLHRVLQLQLCSLILPVHVMRPAVSSPFFAASASAAAASAAAAATAATAAAAGVR